MKMLVLLPALLFCFNLLAQDAMYDERRADQLGSGIASQPFKGANLIILETPDTGAVVLRKFILLLQDAGEQIDKYEKEFLSFNTAFRQISKTWIHEQAIFGYVRGNKIFLTSKWHAQSRMLPGNDVVSKYGTSDSNLSAKAFKIMDAVAKSYPSGKLYYVVK